MAAIRTGRKMAKHKRAKLKKRLKTLRGIPYRSLLAAALAIPSVSASLSVCEAQTRPEDTQVKFYYADYRDYDRGDDRMHVKAPIAWVRSPLLENYAIEASFILDSMSGASTFYHNSLTGASGIGVEDTRRAGDIKLTRYTDDYSVSIGGAFSDEDDYESLAGLLETSVWTEDKNTVVTLGFSGGGDDLTSTLAPQLDESRTTFNFILGVTQILDINSIIQANASYTNGDGFFSDPYKTLDNRPRSRDQWTFLTRYNRYLESFDSSLHSDYRYYTDSWGINSHMVEFAYYQPLGEHFVLRPNIRYYSQTAADFFVDPFPPDDLDGFLSGDQRMSAFGSFTTGLKLIAYMGSGFSADLMFAYLEQRPEWKLGSSGSKVIEPFHARIIAVSLTKAF